jgi:Putative transmembrane protein (PGPGW)
VWENAKRQWREFKHSRPGHRFEQRYERNRQARSDRTWLARYFKPVSGVLLVIAGVVFCVVPGPGLPLLLIGAALLADGSRPTALALDWLEIRVRNGISDVRQWWTQASPSAKCAILFVMILLAGAAIYGGFRIAMS